MKRRTLHALLTPAAALAIATSFVACDKKRADQPATPPGETSAAPSTPGTAAPAKSAEPTKESPKAAAAPSNVSAIRETYGIAAMLPKDVEAFAVYYRMHDLWTKLSESNWAKTLINLPALKAEPKFQQFLQQWNSPQAAKAKELFEAILGNEFALAEPAGFTDKIMPWIDLMGEVQGLQIQRAFMTAMSGGQPPDSAKLFRDAAPDIIPALVKCDIPPVLFAFRAAKAKADIEGGLGMVVAQLGAQLPPGVEIGKFKLADKYDFQNITLNAAKLVEAMQEERIRAQLAELLGDEGKAKQTVQTLKTKKIEIAWGWVGDYLILSIGTDHSHVKFAGSDADSALASAAVARRASQFAGKKPLGLGYASEAMLEKLNGRIEFADAFKKLSDELGTLLKPEYIAAMQTDVKKFEGKVQAVFKRKFDPLVGVSYWDAGIRGEAFGGAQQTALDTTKPLGFASLLTNSMFLFADGRANSANSGKYAGLIEDGAAMLWNWYEKFGKTMVPEDERQGAQMVEMMALPMVKDVWAASRRLSKALGDESAFILDLNGSMPQIPNLPPPLADGKVPRIAWVAELKDRAGVSEAWKGFEKITKQLAALAPGGGVPDPVMKKDGDLELYYIELPVPTGDVLPHIAISKDRWIFSTSPSLSKEIVSKAPATGGTPLGADGRIQVPAACDLAEAWLKIVDKNPALFIHSSSDQKEYAQLRPTFGELLKLGRSIQSIEWRAFSEGAESRSSTYLKLEDIR
ncbi:MAG: hypothetical protein ABI318_23770 [Chthoniobacteraceae bacterium]